MSILSTSPRQVNLSKLSVWVLTALGQTLIQLMSAEVTMHAENYVAIIFTELIIL